MAMHCADLHVNVQDASGDLILAGEMLAKDETSWAQWRNTRGVHRLGGEDDGGHYEENVADVMGMSGKTTKFQKTPRRKKALVERSGPACRIYGSMEVNRVQGDFHITARGHGYMEFGEHLDHSGMIDDAYHPSQLSPEERLGTDREREKNSIQLQPSDQRAVLRAFLLASAQPARQHHRHNGRALLQIPILPVRRADRVLVEHQRQTSHLRLHQPIRRHGAVPSGGREDGAGYLLQVRRRANHVDHLGRSSGLVETTS